MTRELKTFKLTIGDEWIENYYFTDDDDIAYSLSIYDNIWMDIREGISKTSKLLYSISLNNGIEILGDDNNIMRITISSEYTENFKSGIYYRDIRFEKNTEIKTLLKGKVEIRKNIS